MPAALVDHIWQSLWFCTLCASLAWLMRGHTARVRLWLWRLCALKWLVPFSLPFALGRWLGFPAYHSADRVPAPLVRAAEALTPWLAPAQSAHLGWLAITMCLLALLPAAALFAWRVPRCLRVERRLAYQEARRREADPDDVPPGLGFFRGALLALCVVTIGGGALLGGAIADRRWRLDLLGVHARSLRAAPVSMSEAEPGMGTRWRVYADANGILIRNVTLQDLIALAHGISHYAVWESQMNKPSDDPDARSWLVAPRYDVRVRARIVEPDDFDAYALRGRITQYLAERFGLELYINGKCEAPCGTYRVPMPEEYP
jgi:hypothetical protein